MTEVSFVQGAYRILVARLDVNGYAFGDATNPDSPTLGTGYSAYVVDHPIDIGSQNVPRSEALEVGGQKPRGKRDLGPSGFDSVQFTTSSYDMGLDALVSQATVDTSSWTGWTIGASNYTNEALPQVAMWFIGGDQGRDDDNYGIDGYKTILRVGTISANEPGTSQAGGTNPHPSVYTFTPTTFGTLPNGVTMASLSLGYSENILLNFRTRDQFHVYTYYANASDTDFTLPYLPLYDDATGSNLNIITEDGATTAVTSVNAATGLVTLSGAATGGEIFVVTYPTDFVASA